MNVTFICMPGHIKFPASASHEISHQELFQFSFSIAFYFKFNISKSQIAESNVIFEQIIGHLPITSRKVPLCPLEIWEKCQPHANLPLLALNYERSLSLWLWLIFHYNNSFLAMSWALKPWWCSCPSCLTHCFTQTSSCVLLLQNNMHFLYVASLSRI